MRKCLYLYKILDEENVKTFVKENYSEFEKCLYLTSTELSDGNINYVHRVSCAQSGESVIVKQATKFFRSSPKQPLTDERIRLEVQSLNKMHEICPGFVPKIYSYHDDMKCFIMEDCKQYKIMRREMLKFKTYKNFGLQMGEFLAKLHFYTSDFYLDNIQKSNMVNNFLNPELCEITQRLVFTEPFTDCLKRNPVPKELEQLVEKEIYNSEEVKNKAAKLKYKFLTQAQSLIHADLHTGSLFINDEKFKVFDSEFAFVGPCSYDIGCIVGNIMLAYVGANVVGNNKKFEAWALDTALEILTTYKKTFLYLIKTKSKDSLLINKSFVEKAISNIIKDGVATAGVEILRRTITSFKVKDITKLPTKADNIRAQHNCILIGKQLLIDPTKYTNKFNEIKKIKL